MKTEIETLESRQSEITKTSDISHREIVCREILWFIFSFIGFYSMAAILTGMGWLYFKNSPFGLLSLWAYWFCFLGIYGFFRSIKYAEKRTKIRLIGEKERKLNLKKGDQK